MTTQFNDMSYGFRSLPSDPTLAVLTRAPRIAATATLSIAAAALLHPFSFRRQQRLPFLSERQKSQTPTPTRED